MPASIAIGAWVAAALALPPHGDGDEKRGADMFRKTSRTLCGNIVSRMKASGDPEYEEILKRSGVKTEKELGNWIGDHLLMSNAEALALSEDEEKRLKEQTWRDDENRASVRKSIESLSKLKAPLPRFIVHLIEQREEISKTGGLDLEFAARLLAAHVERSKAEPREEK